MTSPPVSPPQLHGSSRVTGGIIHGHALGNTLNAADLEDTVESITFPVMGKVFVFSSDQNLANLNIQTMKPAMFVSTIVFLIREAKTVTMAVRGHQHCQTSR